MCSILISISFSALALQNKWNIIKLQYSKLKILLETGKISREIIDSYAVTKKYFDGSLSFLDPFLGDLTNLDILDIPTNKTFDNLLTSISQASYDQVYTFIGQDNNMKETNGDLDPNDMKYIMNIVSGAVQQRFNAMFLADESQNMEICNFILQNKILEKEPAGKDILTDNGNAVRIDEIHTITSNNNESRKDVLNSDEDSESGVSDDEIRRFFRDLGQAMSQELSLHKQTKLQMQINALVKSELSFLL